MAYDTERKDNESIEHWYRRLAKTADQRMVRLEAYRHEQGFKTADKWAYKKALNDIHKWSGPNATRFNVAPPKSQEKLLEKINDIRSFIESPSSSKQGIISIYQKKADTMNEKYGSNLTWDQLAKYYLTGQNEKWDNKFGSQTALIVIGEIKKRAGVVIKSIKDADQKDKRTEDEITPEMLNALVEEALKDNELDKDALFA